MHRGHRAKLVDEALDGHPSARDQDGVRDERFPCPDWARRGCCQDAAVRHDAAVPA